MISDEGLRVARHLDATHLNHLLQQLSGFGALPGGGVNRQALSEEELDAREWIIGLAREMGCDIYTDTAANLFLRRPGRTALPPVTTGSHIDTQPCGGNFDGCYGVMAGLACLQAMNDAGLVTERPVEVAIWTNEEGSRFAPGAMGSSAFVQPELLPAYQAAVGEDGTPFSDALAKCLARFKTLPQRPDRAMACFLELHIEQGPILEQRGLPLAVVSGIQGVRWYQVTCLGQSAHAGTTPMGLRQDAMSLARAQAAHIEEVMGDTADEALRMTFGRWQVAPNAINTVAAQVSFTLDFRHPDPAVLAHLDALMASLAGERIHITPLLNKAPLAFDAPLNTLLDDVCRALDIPHTRLLSGAFHDAMHLAGHCPTSMLFVPSYKGISHNPEEYTDPRSLSVGASALACALTELARSTKGVYA